MKKRSVAAKNLRSQRGSKAETWGKRTMTCSLKYGFSAAPTTWHERVARNEEKNLRKVNVLYRQSTPVLAVP